MEAAQHFGTERFQAALRAIVDEAVAAESSADRDRPAVVTGLLPRRAARRAAARALKCALRHTKRHAACKMRPFALHFLISA